MIKHVANIHIIFELRCGKNEKKSIRRKKPLIAAKKENIKQ